MTEIPAAIHADEYFPLILFSNKDTLYLKCPYEDYSKDDVTIDVLPDIPDTINVQLDSKDRPLGYEYVRNLFISQTNDQKIITMTAEGGHHRRGIEIEVYSWKDKMGKFSDKYPGDPEEAERIKIVRQVSAEFVSGYDYAVGIHRGRVSSLDLNSISPEQGQEIYEAILYTVPK